MTNTEEDERELKELLANNRGPWHKGEDIIRLAKRLGRPELVREYAPLQRQVYEQMRIYFNNAGTPYAELKIVPDDWRLDGCDSLMLNTFQENYIRLLIDEGQNKKAQELLEKILQHPDTNRFDKPDFEKLLGVSRK